MGNTRMGNLQAVVRGLTDQLLIILQFQVKSLLMIISLKLK